MKFTVESSLVHQLRLSGGVSRVELARRLDLAPSTVSLHVDRLIDDGLVLEGKRAASTIGRPPTLIELNPEAGQFIGIDLDAAEVRAICIDFAQQTHATRRCPIRSGASAASVIELVVEMVGQVRRRGRKLLGIGLAVPGTVDLRRGVAKHYKLIRDWRNLPLVDSMQSRFRVPVHLENNIRSMALAERWFGQGNDVDNYFCLGIRSGIGSGVFLRGQLHRGSSDVAGEIGSWPWFDESVGRTVPLESAASLPAMLSHMAELVRCRRTRTCLKRQGGKVPLDAALQAIERGDSLARCALLRVCSALGQVIAQMQMLMDPQRVIIAGPLAGLGEHFLSPLRDAIDRHLPDDEDPEAEVVGSQLGEYVGALGAAACAVHAWQPQSRPSLSVVEN